MLISPFPERRYGIKVEGVLAGILGFVFAKSTLYFGIQDVNSLPVTLCFYCESSIIHGLVVHCMWEFPDLVLKGKVRSYITYPGLECERTAIYCVYLRNKGVRHR